MQKESATPNGSCRIAVSRLVIRHMLSPGPGSFGHGKARHRQSAPWLTPITSDAVINLSAQENRIAVDEGRSIVFMEHSIFSHFFSEK